ncbi:Ribonuclease Y [Trema orientale]|uniref:5'-deoxynucleotidase n=1 Tax=Trema orientale TaxID=63057 RepID=A0A2P5FNA1_TREOI|nr:Ribonuclease Y [Trema orientale]
MGSVSRAAWLCKSSTLIFLMPSSLSSSSQRLRFKSVTAHSSSPKDHHRMATEASSSPSPLTGGDTINPPASSSSSASSAIDFLSLCHRLKTTKRAGWVRRDVKDPESIADHMYRMGLMALIASDIPGVDRDKCIKMAIVHDIAEAIVGDITPSDGISKTEKSRREREALDHMCKLLGGGSRAKEIDELWMEYEQNSSPEAKIVKDFDKVEMILQALEYENEQGKDLNEFFQSTAGKFQTELGKAWASEIASRRKKED